MALSSTSPPHTASQTTAAPAVPPKIVPNHLHKLHRKLSITHIPPLRNCLRIHFFIQVPIHHPIDQPRLPPSNNLTPITWIRTLLTLLPMLFIHNKARKLIASPELAVKDVKLRMMEAITKTCDRVETTIKSNQRRAGDFIF